MSDIETIADDNGVIQTIIGRCFIPNWSKSRHPDTVITLCRSKTIPHNQFFVTSSMGLPSDKDAALMISSIQHSAIQLAVSTRINEDTGWISIEDSLPEDGQHIEGRSGYSKVFWEEVWNEDEPLGNMTHWRLSLKGEI